MALTPWSAFLPEVAPNVAGCPVPLIENALRRASIQLLRDSRLLTADLDPINVTAGTGKYALTPGANLQILGIETAEFQGEPLDPLALDVAKSRFPDWKTATGEPAFYVDLDRYNVALVKVPDVTVAAALAVNVAIAPGNAATGLDAVIAEAYFDAIASGAKAYLMAQPNKAWTEPKLAIYHENIFKAGVTQAVSVKAEGTGRARRRTVTYYR